MTPKRICILGGSFNPIHMGHLHIARAAQAHCMADEVWFLPAGQPWQKDSHTLAPAHHRLEMVKRAVQGVHSWRVETKELEAKGPSYTVDTLEALCDQYPQHQFTFVIGADQLVNLTSWRHWESLFDFARVGFVDRIQLDTIAIPQQLKKHLIHNHLFRIPMHNVNISSTQIREQFALLHAPETQIRHRAKTLIASSLHNAVLSYILEHKVY
jgi:nicotinate-nucleotide adenylyltransferase